MAWDFNGIPFKCCWKSGLIEDLAVSLGPKFNKSHKMQPSQIDTRSLDIVRLCSLSSGVGAFIHQNVEKLDFLVDLFDVKDIEIGVQGFYTTTTENNWFQLSTSKIIHISPTQTAKLRISQNAVLLI